VQQAEQAQIGPQSDERVAGVWRTWASWLLAFLLIGAGWALVTPVNQYPDESDQVYRAVSVVRGEVFPHIGAYNHGTGATTNIPTTILRSSYGGPCRGIRSPGYCSTASAAAGSVTVVTSEGRNFPLYYALVGWPSLLFPNRAGWYFMRLVSAVWCAVLLATGALVMMSMPRRPLVLAGAMLVGLTPLALDLSGSVNPSGLEAASALCFWAVLLALIHNNSALDRRLVVSFGLISGVVLATCRSLGWLWVVLAVVLSLASVGRADRLFFLRSRAARVILGGAAGAVVVAEAWSVTFHSYQVFGVGALPDGLVAAARTSLRSTPMLLQETLAYLGWLTIPPPAVAEVCWILAAVAVIVISIVTGRRTALLVAAGAALVVVLPFTILTFSFLHPRIGIWQGRYTLPLAIGVPLLGFARSRLGRGEHRIAVLLASCAILLVLWAQLAVYRGASTIFAPLTHYWYASFGQELLAFGALGLLANIAWADIRWSLAGHKRLPAGGA
jgi:hypothetical protein